MTQPDLARLEGLVERADHTRLPWVEAKLSYVVVRRDMSASINGNPCRMEQTSYRLYDDTLATAAVNSLPALLARVRELSEALEPFASISHLAHWDEAADRQQANVYFGEFKSFLGTLKVSDFRRAALTLNRSETDADR